MRFSQAAACGFCFCLLAAYYIYLGYPGLAFIDSGELALASTVLGVPHPTGYPLYVVLSHIATMGGGRPIVAVNVFSALIVAAASVIFFLLVLRLDGYTKNTRRGDALFLSLAGTLIVFLAPVIAGQGLTNEVYGLNLLLVLLFLYCGFLAESAAGKNRRVALYALTLYVAGLALCNHLSSIALLPALVLLSIVMLAEKKLRFASFPLIFLAAVALSLYAVLPLRAAHNPIANWGNVTTWDNFVRHVSGWQFRVWLFTGSASEVWDSFIRFCRLVTDQFPFPFLFLLPFGLFAGFSRRRNFTAALVLLFMVNVFIGINYSIPDIAPYFLPALAVIGLFCIYGAAYLVEKLRYRALVPVILALLCLWQVVQTWNVNDRRDYTLPEDYALNILRSAGPNSIILSETWDHHAQAFYLQQVEHLRPDLRLIDKELMRRSWYYKELREVYPEVYSLIAPYAKPFLKELAVFENRGDYDAATLERHYQQMINTLIARPEALVDGRLAFTPERQYFFKPQGILLEPDTVAGGTFPEQPRLIWRGKPLDHYHDLRALQYIDYARRLEEITKQEMGETLR
jgi:hypothetical protein